MSSHQRERWMNSARELSAALENFQLHPSDEKRETLVAMIVAYQDAYKRGEIQLPERFKIY